ncbi:unnamed protein product [Prunus armeniaca]
MEEFLIDHMARKRASNWGTGLTSKHSRILNTRAPITSPTCANYPAKGLRNAPSKVPRFRHIQVSNNTKYPIQVSKCQGGKVKFPIDSKTID